MKKLILTIAVTAISLGAFAQGEFAFAGGGPRSIWNNFTTVGTPVPTTGIDVAFLFGSTASTPLVDSIYSSTATNGTSALSAGQIQTAWSDVLTDPNFMLGTNNANGSLAIGTSAANGVYSYTPPGGAAGGGFTVNGSNPNGANYHVFIIGWDATYATPQAAAAAGAAIGWSSVFSYASAAGPVPGPAGTPGTFLAAAGTSAPLQFAVNGPTSVPEPATMALFALGGASVLLFRRRK